MRGSVYAVARGPLEGCMDPASVTGRRHTGKPLGQPVKALKPLLKGMLKGPYSRLGSPNGGEIPILWALRIPLSGSGSSTPSS
jgi:hypothetical protein